ncbi:MAG: hypothetical protein O9972_39695 [Burkholderiales bacterium]|nr:hypothetical protein [Burkholderiales bacterium]
MSKATQHAATLAAVLMAEEFRQHVSIREHSLRHPEIVARDALALIRISKGVSRWAVLHCNGRERWDAALRRRVASWTEADDAAKEKADARALTKLQEIASRYGATVTISGDPRGYVVKLKLASGRHNTWGGAADGWGVA